MSTFSRSDKNFLALIERMEKDLQNYQASPAVKQGYVLKQKNIIRQMREFEAAAHSEITAAQHLTVSIETNLMQKLAEQEKATAKLVCILNLARVRCWQTIFKTTSYEGLKWRNNTFLETIKEEQKAA